MHIREDSNVSRLKKNRETILSLIAPLNDETFFVNPEKGKWSVAQVIWHLTLVDKGIKTQILKGKESKFSTRLFLKRFIPMSVIIGRPIVKVKAPGFVDPENIVPSVSREQIVKEFSNARDELINEYLKRSIKEWRKISVKHPVLGDIDGEAMIKFVGFHELRHLRQIRELANLL